MGKKSRRPNRRNRGSRENPKSPGSISSTYQTNSTKESAKEEETILVSLEQKSKKIDASQDLSRLEPLAEIDPTEIKAAISKFEERGYIGFHKLAKVMPETAEALRNEKITPKEALKGFALALKRRFVIWSAHLLKHILVSMVWPEGPEEFSSDQNLDLKKKFTRSFSIHIVEIQQLAGIDVYFQFEKLSRSYELSDVEIGFWQKAMACTCKDLSDEMDNSLFGGKQGSFKEVYGIHKAPFVTWKNYINITLKGLKDADMKRKQEMFDEASKFYGDAQMVWAGLDQVRDCCWECNANIGHNSLQKCSGCAVAHYCSKRCHRKAWNGGHKQKCEALKEKNELLENALNFIDNIHLNRLPSGSDFYTNPETDYDIAGVIATCHNLHWREFVMMSEPTMDCYYRNLAAVQEGRWWLFDGFDASIEEYENAKEKNDNLNRYLQTKEKHILGTLSFDLEAMAKKILAQDSALSYAHFTVQSNDGQELKYLLPMTHEDSADADSILADRGAKVYDPAWNMDSLEATLLLNGDLLDAETCDECVQSKIAKFRDLSRVCNGNAEDNALSVTIAALLESSVCFDIKKVLPGFPRAIIEARILNGAHKLSDGELRIQRKYQKWCTYSTFKEMYHK